MLRAVAECGAVRKIRGTPRQRGGWHAHDHGRFCSCTPAMYEPHMQAFSPHVSRGYTDQKNSQPVTRYIACTRQPYVKSAPYTVQSCMRRREHYAAIWYPRRTRERRVGPRVRRADCLGPNGAAKSSTGTPENRGGSAGLGHEFYLAPEPQRADR